MSYQPSKQNVKILNRAMEHIQSVPYSVSLRWVFYRLLQEGLYSTKEDYKTFIRITSRARKRYFGNWKPDTVEDDTRAIIWKGTGVFDEAEWIESLQCKLDKIQSQEYFVMICFEARAMADQFAHYTKNIPLVPFGGDASIPHKWRIAKAIEYASNLYDKPVVVLYFGDADKKGKKIPTAAFKDIKAWCSVDFELINCGLTLDQAEQYNLPENPDKPGEYQWESLTDTAANEIITTAVAHLQNEEGFAEIEELEIEILERAKDKLEVKQ